MSNGGMMAQRVACDMPDVVVGVVSVAANMPAELAAVCAPRSPVAIMFINGVQDPIVPYAGGEIKILRNSRGTVLSTEASLAFWQKQGECTALPDMPFTANSVHRNYRCERGRLRLISVSDGGHAWPGGSPYLPGFMIGKTTTEFSASEQIVEFLLAHP
jgi:polyhydroxybutyrate depolymerase